MTPVQRELVLNNLGIAKAVAIKVVKIFRWLDLDDLVGQASLSLVKSAIKWQPQKGKFSVYAYECAYKNCLKLARQERLKGLYLRSAYKHNNPVFVSIGESQPESTTPYTEPVSAFWVQIKEAVTPQQYLILERLATNPQSTHREIGRDVGSTHRNVRYNINKARAKLRGGVNSLYCIIKNNSCCD